MTDPDCLVFSAVVDTSAAFLNNGRIIFFDFGFMFYADHIKKRRNFTMKTSVIAYSTGFQDFLCVSKNTVLIFS